MPQGFIASNIGTINHCSWTVVLHNTTTNITSKHMASLPRTYLVKKQNYI